MFGKHTGLRVHIAHEDPQHREMWAMALEGAGFEVAISENSLLVFDDVKASKANLVLMSQGLEYLNGVDQAKLMSLDDDLEGIPIILVAGNETSRQRATRENVSRMVVAFLVEPLSEQEVVVAVATALEHRFAV